MGAEREGRIAEGGGGHGPRALEAKAGEDDLRGLTLDSQSMLASTVHWQPLLNGYTAYEAPSRYVLAAIAQRRGMDPLAAMYDLMLEADAGAMLMYPMFNYSDGNHDAIREMLTHPAGVLGLSDGGAHCSMICDASYPTFLLTHWARDRKRGERLPLEMALLDFQLLVFLGGLCLALQDNKPPRYRVQGGVLR